MMTSIVGLAQMSDMVKVTLSQGVMVGTVKLPAGAYTIRDLSDGGSSSSVLQIRSDNGIMVVAEVMRISGSDTKRPDRTEVILRRESGKYQVDKIWLQGRDYGCDLLHELVRYNSPYWFSS